MKPTIGRIVHFQDPGQIEPRPAIITGALPDDSVALEIFGAYLDDRRWFQRGVPHALGDKPTPGCWNWPPRETASFPVGLGD